MNDTDPIETLISEFKKLKAEYDRYFQGLDRIPPHASRDRFRKHFSQVQQSVGSHATHTAQRFRLQSLQTTLTTHEALWDRICRQIEEGTYRRDRLRAERHAQEAQPPKQHTQSHQTYSAGIQQLHAVYLKTQEQLGHSDNNMSIDALAKTVKEQMQLTKQRTGCKHVACKVVIKQGETVLEFVPKTEQK